MENVGRKWELTNPILIGLQIDWKNYRFLPSPLRSEIEFMQLSQEVNVKEADGKKMEMKNCR